MGSLMDFIQSYQELENGNLSGGVVTPYGDWADTGDLSKQGLVGYMKTVHKVPKTEDRDVYLVKKGEKVALGDCDNASVIVHAFESVVLAFPDWQP